MEERELFVPPGGPPQGPPPPREILTAIGEDGIRQLLIAHYQNLGASEIQNLFPKDLERAALKSADFFIQLLGGPPYYSQKYGPPRMRARHLPFPITPEAQETWLRCFRQALDDNGFPGEYREDFEAFLISFSSWMVNTR